MDTSFILDLAKLLDKFEISWNDVNSPFKYILVEDPMNLVWDVSGMKLIRITDCAGMDLSVCGEFC